MVNVAPRRQQNMSFAFMTPDPLQFDNPFADSVNEGFAGSVNEGQGFNLRTNRPVDVPQTGAPIQAKTEIQKARALSFEEPSKSELLRQQEASVLLDEDLAGRQQTPQQGVPLGENLPSVNPFQDEGIIDTTQAIGGAVGGAITGAAAGSFVPIPIVGTLGGAIVGATVGAFTAISVDKREDVREAIEVYKGAKGNFAFIINEVNAGRMAPMTASQLWNTELANFYAAERNLKRLNKNSLQRALSSGKEEARRIEAFKRRLPELQRNLEVAMMRPNPNSLAVDFTEPEDLNG